MIFYRHPRTRAYVISHGNVSNAQTSSVFARIERAALLSIASASPGTPSWFKVHPDPDAGWNSMRIVAESRSIGFARLTESTVRIGATFRCEFPFAKHGAALCAFS